MDNITEKSDQMAEYVDMAYKMAIEHGPKLILAILTLLIGLWVIKRFVNTTKNHFISKADPTLGSFIGSLLSVLLKGVLLIAVASMIGIETTSFIAVLGAAGLAIGLALQNTLSNTVAGIVLSFRKKIQIGNWVETNGFSGEVIDINLKEFVLKEADNNIVIMPNKMILENPLKNYSLTTKMRVAINCGVGYESDLEEVKELTKKTISDSFKQVKDQKDVEFYYTEFGDSSINFKCRFWIDAESMLEKLHAKTTAIIEIKKAFDKAGINIPFPIRTLQFDNNLTFNASDSSKTFSNN